MHFSAAYRHNTVTGTDEPCCRLKETYRDAAGIVRSRIVLSPGFIKGLSGEQLRRVSPGLTYRMEHRGECALFECTPSGYEPVVREQINLLRGMMASQGRIDIDREKDMLRIESERKLVDSETTENREARETGAEWCCYLPEFYDYSKFILIINLSCYLYFMQIIEKLFKIRIKYWLSAVYLENHSYLCES
jgi:hypothetical protein